MSDGDIDQSINQSAPGVIFVDRLGRGGTVAICLLLVVALILASAALIVTTMNKSAVEKQLLSVSNENARLEREVRLMQLKQDDFKVALAMQGIDPNLHLASDSP